MNGLQLCAAARKVVGSNPNNACGYICKYMGEKRSAVILATKRSAWFTPEVNLRNPLPTGGEASKRVWTRKEYKRAAMCQCKRRPSDDCDAQLPSRTHAYSHICLFSY